MDLEAQEQQTPEELKIVEPIYPNTIAFNGELITNIIDVGGDCSAFQFLAGKEKIEMPLVLIKEPFEKVKGSLKIGDKISGVGILEKMQGQFVINAYYISKVPTEEEMQKINEILKSEGKNEGISESNE